MSATTAWTPEGTFAERLDALGEGTTGHQLRHLFACRVYAQERDILAVRELLGHASVATTQRYTQVPLDALRSAVGGLPGPPARIA